MYQKTNNKNTVNIYKVLELLDKKIDTNTLQIKLNNQKQKIQLDDLKIYLLKTIKEKIESAEKSFFDELDTYKEKTNKNLIQNQKELISKSFKKLKIDINNDLENLTERIMNSRIL